MGIVGWAIVCSGLLLSAGCAAATTAPTAVAPTPAGTLAAPTSVPTAAATAPSSATPVAASPSKEPAPAAAARVAATSTPAPRPPASTPAPRPSQPAPATPTAMRPLFLEVVEPSGELVEVPEGTARITLAGRTVPSAVVSVDGRLVDPDGSGAFRTEVALQDDITVVEVVASDAAGTEVRAQLTVVR